MISCSLSIGDARLTNNGATIQALKISRKHRQHLQVVIHALEKGTDEARIKISSDC